MKKIEVYKELSKLDNTNRSITKLEQYSIDIDLAYDLISFIDSEISIKDKKIADIGCGNGILGITASIFGAGLVDMYDIDKNSIATAKSNILKIGIVNVNAIELDLFDIDTRYDIVISNPPFGFQSNFNIEAFIKKLKGIADNIFFIYKDNSNIAKIAEKNNLNLRYLGNMKLGKTMNFHKKNNYILPIVVIYSIKQI
jgi:predicted RNA methylase